MKGIIKSTISVIAFGFIIINCNLCFADQIETKDGSIVKGKIIEHSIGKGYKIRTSDGNIFYFEESNILTIKYGPNEGEQEAPAQIEPAQAKSEPVYTYRKSPGLAWFFSFLYPGAGNFYARDKVGGSLFISFATVGLIGLISGFSEYDDRGCDYYDEYGYAYEQQNCEDFETLGVLGTVLFIGMSVGSQITAPIQANRRNYEPEEISNIEKKQFASLEEPKPSLHLSINPDFVKNKKGMKLALQYDF